MDPMKEEASQPGFYREVIQKIHGRDQETPFTIKSDWPTGFPHTLCRKITTLCAAKEIKDMPEVGVTKNYSKERVPLRKILRQMRQDCPVKSQASCRRRKERNNISKECTITTQTSRFFRRNECLTNDKKTIIITHWWMRYFLGA